MKNYVVSGKDGLAKAAGLHLLGLLSSRLSSLFSDHLVLSWKGGAGLICNSLGGGIVSPARPGRMAA